MLKDIKTKKSRDESGLFFVEGERFIAEIPEEYEICYYVISRNFADTHDLSVYKKRAKCEVVRDSIFKSIADTVTPQGVMAVCEKKIYSLENILQANGFILLCENLRDPGNIGTLVRTASAAGAGGAIFSNGSCEVYSPKVLRSAAGAVLRLPIISDIQTEETLVAIKKEKTKIFAAHPRGNDLPYNLNMKEKFCLLIGNESHGISKEAQMHADATVRLPMTNETESLNASVAGSILMYEAVRQRMDSHVIV
ncbi:MAG: RNA methyltransferase [Clostridiales bacterium]|jgi:TrmH family RNA methyltransferase|nr:RNA methyltransferase [Clostridiales bacterium]